jgi:ankyrin repeat protein
MERHSLGPIHRAVMVHNLPQLREALTRGENVDELDRESRTPLFYAVRDGDLALVSELIGHGANPDARDRSRWSPLHFAAQGYWPEVAELLLKRGATVDARDDYGNTPLWRAVFSSRGRGDVIKVLLSAGADKNLKNNHNVSPLDLANTIASHNIKPFLVD